MQFKLKLYYLYPVMDIHVYNLIWVYIPPAVSVLIGCVTWRLTVQMAKTSMLVDLVRLSCYTHTFIWLNLHVNNSTQCNYIYMILSEKTFTNENFKRNKHTHHLFMYKFSLNIFYYQYKHEHIYTGKHAVYR